MKNIRKEILVWIQLVSFVEIWAAVLFFSRTSLKIEWEAIKKLPDVVTIYVLLVLIFTNWAWRLPIFKGWLVPFPDLQGTWKGTLQSTWIDPATSQKIQPKDVMLVIKQTFSNISCVMYTDESNSFSNTAQINQDDDSGIFRLSYNYTNRSKANVRDRSVIHDGAAILKVITEPEKSLEGEYRTSRKTTGDISVKFISKKLSQTNS
ncbi:hypothetical protein AUJ29_01245 [Candidatus Kuenenbacteria bacterium CG1_02_38_13]|uniref:CD-NTase-associated protein 15 domain-containing protein n=1 Tax=Candidatus Kuenenbacteria bacterium CG1_02_38_13 TaxID=1805235 RepID=A0A1J4U2I0_9BACT|nr:MAG: hypothetical protein AUJ29_01245 [Candidatus Kuenenbacteria bacterium CG1_02_38_13]